jgi:phosphotransferase system HPr (HPr) family protein
MLTSGHQVDRAKILVVDDYPDTAESTARWLHCLGHHVQIARDGHQAIDIARRQRPDIVLLDLGLPGLDGYQVASTLRRELHGPLIIIAVTGYGQEEDRRLAREAGCDYHFLKPIDPGILSTLLAASYTGPDSPGHDGSQTEVANGERRPGLNRQVEITNALGLHLRAAAKFVRLAQQFRAEIRVACDGRSASGRSILDLATLAAACGSRLALDADGPDAEAALDALTDLIGRRFDEEN